MENKLRKITTLNAKEMRSKFPKTVNRIIDWIYDPSMFEGEVISASEPEKQQLLDFTLQFNARFLFDFFDDMGISISITVSEEGMFIYYLGKNSYSQAATDRNTAEEKAFMLAFEELEKQL